MANGSKPVRAHEGKRLQQIQSSHIVPNRFHRSTLIAERFEIRMIIRQQRVRRRQDYKAALGQLDPVSVVGATSSASDDFLPERIGWMQNENGWRFGSWCERFLWDKKICRHAGTGFGRIADKSLDVRAAIHFLFETHFE